MILHIFFYIRSVMLTRSELYNSCLHELELLKSQKFSLLILQKMMLYSNILVRLDKNETVESIYKKFELDFSTNK